MRDMRKGTKKVMQKPAMQQINKSVEELDYEELNRGCKTNKCNNDCNPGCNTGCNTGCNKPQKEKMICECECVCSQKPVCEPCEIEADECIDNVALCGGTGCCSPIVPKCSTANSAPYAIEASRIYDTMKFQTFTDALAENGAPLSFDYEVVEVRGSVPRGGYVNLVIDKVCINYSSISIDPGCTTLEDFELELVENAKPCETTFDYAVCVDKNSKCCKQGKGQSVVYKQRGVTVTVEDLVLELRGHCGCTEVVALAYPSTRVLGNQQRHRCGDVEFIFNTLSAPICCPADGRGVTLRQDYQTGLTVDCVGKAMLKYIETDCCECYYELCIPNDIDLICCLQLTVSTLIEEQIVVLGIPGAIQPRVVDTFSKVCDFSGCGDTDESNKKGHCGC
ncbi:MAG: exosporium morphogenetic protein CdeC [Peptostreptococcaceae bacterium]